MKKTGSRSTRGIHCLSKSLWFPQVLLLFLLSFKFIITFSFCLTFSPTCPSFGERKESGKIITGHTARFHMGVLHILFHTVCRGGTIVYIHVLLRWGHWLPKVQKPAHSQITCMWYCWSQSDAHIFST